MPRAEHALRSVRGAFTSSHAHLGLNGADRRYSIRPVVAVVGATAHDLSASNGLGVVRAVPAASSATGRRIARSRSLRTRPIRRSRRGDWGPAGGVGVDASPSHTPVMEFPVAADPAAKVLAGTTESLPCAEPGGSSALEAR
jgi:hypothetical protein